MGPAALAHNLKTYDLSLVAAFGRCHSDSARTVRNMKIPSTSRTSPTTDASQMHASYAFPTQIKNNANVSDLQFDFSALPLSALLVYTMPRSIIIQDVESVDCFSWESAVDSFPNRHHPGSRTTTWFSTSHITTLKVLRPPCAPRSAAGSSLHRFMVASVPHHRHHFPVRTRRQSVTSTIGDTSPFFLRYKAHR